MTTPLFNWLRERSVGILAHVSSLPSPYGIGNFGKGAHDFVDFLSDAGMRLWQVCPLGPTGYGDSPYQSFSAFALNPYFIDLEKLIDFNAITAEDLAPLRALPQERVDYGALYATFWPILEKAANKFLNNPQRGDLHLIWKTFLEENHAWVEPYCAFMALKARFKGQSWTQWPAEFRNYQKAQQSPLFAEIVKAGEKYAVYQCIAFSQWRDLREYAGNKGVQVIGDIPIFVASDSADVWSNPELFDLTAEGLPASQAGVPPDYFSQDGQLWGNPLYNWKAHAKSKYAWWLSRLKTNLDLYDIVRLDHFRGFESYWSVPPEEKTARTGKWIPGPGIELFASIAKAFPDCKLIAEDLGDLTPGVHDLLMATGLPGMSILQFAFGGDEKNVYLPHHALHNQVLYPGTHDNNTARGWYETTSEATRLHAQRYLGINGSEISWDLVRAAYRNIACIAIIPLQDLLNLGSEGRMNTPSTAQGNWSWRISPQALQQLHNESTRYLHDLGALYGRLSPRPRPNTRANS
ncbi:MAG: 4-alpha-glucanotransferase [Verrucomicrobia bacterium 21-51-4]|nr:MAG: 4-alpha-glucanotransferase [Verrucomicrobia bacterium 21-51-4]HQU08575.1 4-alpha-glucanotransferase [Opitutales bacterium]